MKVRLDVRLLLTTLVKLTLITSTVSKVSLRNVGWGSSSKRVIKQRLLTLPEYIKTRPPINLTRPKTKTITRHPRGHDAR